MADILILIWHSFYFMLPIYFGNMAPVLMKWLDFLNFPVDFGKKLWDKPLFGSHKTWRGLFFAPIFGAIIFLLQKLIGWNSFIDYSQYSFAQGVLFGALLGFGAVFGDLVKSFFKRRVGIKSGDSWIPFDQIDLIIGAVLLTLPLHAYTGVELGMMLALTFFLTILSNNIGYILKLRDTRI